MFKYLIPGVLVFSVVALPWHFAMYSVHGMDFISNYFLKHHFARFIDSSEGINRAEPFYFFIPVLIVGFIPWIFSFFAFLIPFGTKIKISGIKNLSINNLNNRDKFLIFCFCYFLFSFMFFSISSTKLMTYILPLYPAISLLTGYYWYNYLDHNENIHGIKIAAILFCILCFITGIIGIFLPSSLAHKLGSSFIPLRNVTIFWLLLMSSIFVILIKLDKKFPLFLSHVIFMAGIVIISINYVIPVIYNSGENELVNYAKYAKSFKNRALITFNYGVRPSVLFNYGKKVHFILFDDYGTLIKLTGRNKNSLVIIKSSQIQDLSKNIRFNLLMNGKKYSLLSQISKK